MPATYPSDTPADGAGRSALPLAPDVASVAVIGRHADRGVLAGGGSSQGIPPGGIAVLRGSATVVWDFGTALDLGLFPVEARR